MHLPRLRRPSRVRGGLLGTVTALILAFPVGVLAGATFNDVPTSHPFYNDVEALVASGVTAGCGGGNYCPNAFVTRGQMAAFMNRLGALQAGKTPVVNATRLDGLSSEHLAPKVLTARDDASGLDLSSSKDICETDTYTPQTNALAIISTNVSIEAPGTGSMQWGTKAVSKAGAASYVTATPDWWHRVTSPTSEYAAVAGDGVVELTAGTAYNFAVRVNRFSGQTTTAEYICTVLVEIQARPSGAGVVAGTVSGTVTDGTSNSK